MPSSATHNTIARFAVLVWEHCLKHRWPVGYKASGNELTDKCISSRWFDTENRFSRVSVVQMQTSVKDALLPKVFFAAVCWRCWNPASIVYKITHKMSVLHDCQKWNKTGTDRLHFTATQQRMFDIQSELLALRGQRSAVPRPASGWNCRGCEIHCHHWD